CGGGGGSGRTWRRCPRQSSTRGRVRSGNFSPCGGAPAVPAEQVQEFAAGLGPVGTIVRLRMLAVGVALTGDAIGAGVLFHFVGADRIGAGRVLPQKLGAPGRGGFGGAGVRAQFWAGLERAECRGLVLW